MAVKQEDSEGHSNHRHNRNSPRHQSFGTFLNEQLKTLSTASEGQQVINYIAKLEQGIEVTNEKIEKEFKRSSELFFALHCFFRNSKEVRQSKDGIYKKMEDAGIIWNLQGVSDIRQDFELVLAEEMQKQAALREGKLKLQMQKVQANAAKMRDNGKRRGRNEVARKVYKYNKVYSKHKINNTKAQLKSQPISYRKTVRSSQRLEEDEEYEIGRKRPKDVRKYEDDYSDEQELEKNESGMEPSHDALEVNEASSGKVAAEDEDNESLPQEENSVEKEELERGKTYSQKAQGGSSEQKRMEEEDESGSEGHFDMMTLRKKKLKLAYSEPFDQLSMAMQAYQRLGSVTNPPPIFSSTIDYEQLQKEHKSMRRK